MLFIGYTFCQSQEIPVEWKDGLLYASMLHDKVQEFYAMYR